MLLIFLCAGILLILSIGTPLLKVSVVVKRDNENLIVLGKSKTL